MKQSMGAALAHEINNPLAVLKGKLDVLRRLLATNRFDRDLFSGELEKMEAALLRLATTFSGVASSGWHEVNAVPPGHGLALVIEDEADLAATLKFFLAEAGINSVTCSNGEEALRLLTDGKFGVVISDYRLPDLNGDELLRLAPDRGTPWIFVSAFPDIQTRVGGDPRVRQILRKPVGFRQIVEAAYTVLTLAR